MPRLPALFSDLVTSSPLPIDSEAEALAELHVRDLRLVAERGSDLLGAGVGHLLAYLGVPATSVPPPITAASLRATPGYGGLLIGERTLAAGAQDAALVRACQRALQATAARIPEAPLELALATWGADGSAGAEMTRAIEGLRAWRHLPPKPHLDAACATELLALLASTSPPDLFAWAPVSTSGARAIVTIARGICAAGSAPYVVRLHGRAYAFTAAHFGTRAPEDGWLVAPDGVRYRLKPGLDQWKCNIFGGVVIALADLPVPTHRVGTDRHYPRAERFGPLLAHKPGWTMVQALDLRDPADPTTALTGAAQDDAVRGLLQATLPGDLLFVDHPGDPRDGGGHTRVCVEAAAPDDPDAAPLFAQAREDAAREVRDGLSRLGGGQEIQLWLVRWTGA